MEAKGSWPHSHGECQFSKTLFFLSFFSIPSQNAVHPLTATAPPHPGTQRVGPQSDPPWVERCYILWVPLNLVSSHPGEGAMQPNLPQSWRLMSHTEPKPIAWPTPKLSPPCVRNEVLLGWQEKFGGLHEKPPMVCFTEECTKYHCHRRFP